MVALRQKGDGLPHGSFGIPNSGLVAANMAAAAAAHPHTIPLEEKSGVYVLRVLATVGDDEAGGAASTRFPRQGCSRRVNWHAALRMVMHMALATVT